MTGSDRNGAHQHHAKLAQAWLVPYKAPRLCEGQGQDDMIYSILLCIMNLSVGIRAEHQVSQPMIVQSNALPMSWVIH